MTVDLLIVSDGKDDLKRYINPLEQALRYTKPKIKIERTITSFVDTKCLPYARKILFLLHGSKERAARVCRSWTKHMIKQTEPYILRNSFIINIDPDNLPNFQTETNHLNSELSPNSNLINVNDIDLMELWVPQFVRYFFIVEYDTKKDIWVYIKNMSPDYTIANKTETSVKQIFSDFGIRLGQPKVTTCTIAIVRSGNEQNHRTLEGLDGLKNTTKQVYCIGTGGNSNQLKENISKSKYLVHGRPDIVLCVVKAMSDVGLIIISNNFRRLFKLYKLMLSLLRLLSSALILVMHIAYSIGVLPMVAFFCLGLFSFLRVFHLGELEEISLTFSFQTINNLGTTILHLGLLWGIDWGDVLGTHVDDYVYGILTIFIVIFYIVVYTIVDTIVSLLFRRWVYGKYEYGIFDLPWAWWR